MFKRNITLISLTGISCCIAVCLLIFGFSPVGAQVKYNAANELSEAKMGVERVARYYLPAYSNRAANNSEIRWVQIDLGQSRKIDGIKLLPGARLPFM